MKRLAISLCLLLSLSVVIGCAKGTATTPPAALAPGFTSSADQKLSQDLAAVNAFTLNERANYECKLPAQVAGTQPCLTDTRKAKEKGPLNVLITAVNVANEAIVSYHQGTMTLAVAQSKMQPATDAMTQLASLLGVK